MFLRVCQIPLPPFAGSRPARSGNNLLTTTVFSGIVIDSIHASFQLLTQLTPVITNEPSEPAGRQPVANVDQSER